MSSPVKRKKQDTDVLLKELNSINSTAFFYDNLYFEKDGTITFPFYDSTKDYASDQLSLNKYDDLQLINFELPADVRTYPKEAIAFWKAAKNVPEAPANHKDFYIEFKASIANDHETFIGNGDASNNGGRTVVDTLTSTQSCVLVKYYLEETLFKKYVKTYKIFDDAKNVFFNKRLFDIKTCLKENNNRIRFQNEFQPATDQFVDLVYNSTKNIFESISFVNTISTMNNYFYKVYEASMDIYMYVRNGGLQRVDGFFDYLFPTSKGLTPANSHQKINNFIGSDLLPLRYAYMDAYRWLKDVLNWDRPDIFMSNVDTIDDKYLIALKPLRIFFAGRIPSPTPKCTCVFYMSNEKFQSLKKSYLWNQNSQYFQFSSHTATEIKNGNNLSNDEMEKLSRGDPNRMLWEIRILRDFDFWLVDDPLMGNPRGEYINGLIEHFWKDKDNLTIGPDTTLDWQIGKTTYVKGNWDFKVVPTLRSANIFKDANYSLVLKNNAAIASADEIRDIYTSFLLSDLTYYVDSDFYEHDGELLNQNDKNVALIAYTVEGNTLYVPAYNDSKYNVFGFLNVNFADVSFSVNGQNYSQVLNSYNLPTVKSKNPLNLTELHVNVRDFKGQPFVGRVKKGLYPAKNSLFIKNFDKRAKTINMINSMRTDYVTQQIWLTALQHSV